MVNLCICSMQVHQSRFSLFFFPSFLPSSPFFILSGCFLVLAGVCARPLDAVLGLVVVHGLLSLGQEGVHALVGAQEPVHAHDGLEGQDAAEKGRRRG